MAKKGSFSKVYDKNGDYVDVEAVRFDGTRTVQIQGDVTATQTWNGDSSSPLTLNASIGAKKVTQDKIGDKAVGSGQMADGSVGLTQMAASAMTDTVSANNSKLVTSQGVNAAIAAATLNRGKDYGPLSVDEINAISETIPTGSTVYVESLGASDAKVINDGYSDGTMASFSVEVGEDLKYYRSPDNSLHGWHSTEANVKIKQPANYSGGIAVDSAQDASSGSAGIEFIQSFKQNTNGNITNIVKAQVDLVDSTSSTRTNAAATPNAVKSAYDLANTANTGLANKLDKTGDGKDVTVSFSEASTRANIGTGEKLSVMFGKIKKWFTDLGTAAFKNVPASGNASSTEVVLGSDTRLSAGASAIQGVKVNNTTLTPDANKVVTVPLATTSADGAMSAADKMKLNGIAAGAEANVQSDWNQTDTTADNFIKNKPYYTKYVEDETVYKVCTLQKYTDTSVNSSGIELFYRRGAGAVHGKILHKSATVLYLDRIGDVSTNYNTIRWYYSEISGGLIQLFAKQQAYCRLSAAPLVNMPKLEVNFDSFGTVVSAIPEGATEITPVWVANSASSSGTAPVKVDAYGALTPVPMDSTPTESSTNLVTSGGVKTALDGKASANNSVTIYDASVVRVNTPGNSWYKIAEVPLKNGLQFRNAVWDVFANVNDDPGVYRGRLILKSQSNSSAVSYANATLYADAWNRDVFDFKTVAKTTLNNGYVQIWAKVGSNISSLSISERFLFGGMYKPLFKGLFTYTSYDSVAGSAEPQTDAQNNIVANPATLIYHQHAIANPTNNNLVAMDANGLVKDSGVAVLPSTSTWDGTSDAKVPTAKAVQAKLDDAISSSYKYLGILVSGDLNDKRDVGYYSLAGTFTNLPRNAPAGGVYGTLQNLYADGAEVARTQILYLRNGTQQELMWVRHYSNAPAWSPWVKVLRSSDVTSIYNPSGTSPIDGAGVSSALATSLTDVSYVAAQSGGGGNLNKTINGTTTSVLAFMNDTEAVAIWADAKTAAANAS